MIILYIIAMLIALVLISALFISKKYHVKREIIINRPKSEVFEYIKYIRNQEHYSVWNSMDPDMRKTYSGTDGTPGYVYAWDSDNKKVGKGEQEIKSVNHGEGIHTELRFIKPFEGRADAALAVTALSENQTNVTWDLHSSMKYPMNFMLLFMDMDKMIGKDFAQGLSNLKAQLEK